MVSHCKNHNLVLRFLIDDAKRKPWDNDLPKTFTERGF